MKMRLTKKGNRILIETRTRLESGEIAFKLTDYKILDVIGSIGEMNFEDLEVDAPALYRKGGTRRYWIELECVGRVVKKGVLVAG